MNSLFAIPGYFLVEECSATSAGNLDWFMDRFVDEHEIPDGRKRYEYFDAKVAGIAPEDSVGRKTDNGKRTGGGHFCHRILVYRRSGLSRDHKKIKRLYRRKIQKCVNPQAFASAFFGGG
jgi:hypothetical protein